MHTFNKPAIIDMYKIYTIKKKTGQLKQLDGIITNQNQARSGKSGRKLGSWRADAGKITWKASIIFKLLNAFKASG